MSTMGVRDFRPKIHFTAPSMWINDPNGMFFANGTYHLFYQYHPGSTVWGPMHWGHAVSQDLIHWKHLPVALYPDSLGTIFSGSAVYDAENTSGLGAMGCSPVVAIYTQNLEGPNGKSDRKQHQSIAYSLDGINFIKYFNNPVLPCPPDQTDFRDPKVFKNQIINCWSMVVSSGDHVEFYRSDDLLRWDKTGEFGQGTSLLPHQGIWECPDLFRLQTPDGTKDIFIVSLSLDAEYGGSRTGYFTGVFDGYTFVPDPQSKFQWLDQGFDNYAGVTFNHSDHRILMGWASNWKYASQCPTNEYCGAMTLARKLSLIKTPDGYRLASAPAGLQSLITNLRLLNDRDVITSEVFGLDLRGNGDGIISFSNDRGQTLQFGIKDNSLFFDRSSAGRNDFSKEFNRKYFSERFASRFFSGPWQMEVIFDVSHIELFLDHGTVTMSCCIYPDTPYTQLEFTGDIAGRYMDFRV